MKWLGVVLLLFIIGIFSWRMGVIRPMVVIRHHSDIAWEDGRIVDASFVAVGIYKNGDYVCLKTFGRYNSTNPEADAIKLYEEVKRSIDK